MASSAKSRKRTSLQASTLSQSSKVECRVCLQYVCCEEQCCDIFGPWNQNPEATISCYFTQVTNIQVSPSDRHTKYICFKCLALLQNCVLFIEEAKHSEAELQKRCVYPIKNDSESLWPRPIQVDKCLNNDNMIEIEVKQEVLSEDEVPTMEIDNEELRMDIKIEPEEYSSYDCLPQIMDTISIMPIPEDEIVNNSAINRYEDETYLDEHIKEEPVSDDESEVTPDLPLDCMLCTKTFHSVSGLKAHVIAQHSYLTIARKKEVTQPMYQCFTCRRTFITRTDLIVHGTCHGEYACYMCNAKFESFMLLTKHRKRCRNNGDHVSRLKTLEDVKRPSPEQQHTEIADLTNKKPASTNAVPLTQKMHDVETNMSTKVDTEIESQTIHIKAGDSTMQELKSQKTHDPKSINSNTKESLKMHHSHEKDSTKTESKSQKTHHPIAVESTNKELKSQNIDHPKAGDITYSMNIELQSQKIYLTTEALEELETHETCYVQANSTDTESQKIQQTVDKSVLDSTRNSAKTSNNNSLQDSNSSNANKLLTEDNHSITKENNADSKVNNLDSEVNNHNSRNNSNTDSNNSYSEIDNSIEINNSNRESTNKNQNLKTHSTESEDFNITNNSPNDTNDELNSPDYETNIKIEVSSKLGQGQSFDTNSINSNLESGITEMTSSNLNVELNSDHILADQNILSEQNNLALESVNSISKNSNLEIDNKESVVEVNKTKSQAECANMSLEVSKHSVENTHIVAESDSMEIHLAIHSLKKESLGDISDVKIDEEMIETTESNDDKVLQ